MRRIVVHRRANGTPTKVHCDGIVRAKRLLRCLPSHGLQFVAALLIVCWSEVALAAADSWITVGAAVGLSTQAAGDSDRPYLGPGFGGTSLSSIIFVDAALNSAISVGGEVSLAADITGSQDERVSGGSNALLSQHHDTIFSAVFKVNIPASNQFHLAAGGGIGLAGRETNRTGTFRPNVPPFLLTPVAENLSDTVLALTGCVDGVIAIRNRIGILGLVRVHYLADNDRGPGGVVHRGVSSLIVRYGVGAQIRF
jgi:hypothetical protein